ncbi:histidine phosphatase family protein [Mycolicibacterium thermoresistibile]
MRDRRILRVLFTAAAAALLFVVSAIPAWAMTVTFVRHGESQANADHVIETDIPGRGLTAQGEAEAAAIAAILADRNFDRIYSSPLARTMATADHLARLPGQPDIRSLESLREIPGGWFEGAPDDGGIERLLYGLPAMAWTLGLRFIPVLGSEDGNAFDARVDSALRQMYDDGAADDDVVAFGHGATIMFWTMMNVDNPDLLLMLGNTLGNTDTVVIDGSPDDGWTLVEWAGVEVSPNPSLITKLFVETRDLIVAPQTALHNIGQAFRTGDVIRIADAIRDGIVDVADTTLRFVPNVVGDVVDSVREVIGRSAGPEPSAARAETLETTTLTGRQAGVDSGPTALITDDTTSARQSSLEDITPQRTKGATDLRGGNKAEPAKATGVSRVRATPRDSAAPTASAPAETTDRVSGAVTRCRACA